jgi:hypothetical protein
MIPRMPLRPFIAGCAIVLLLPGASLAEPAKSKGADDVLITSRTDKADGTTAMTVGRRLPTEWDSKIGVDLGVDASATTTPTPEAHLDGSWRQDRSSGAGWASLTVPTNRLGIDKATVEARVDPAQDQGKLTTTLSKSVAVGTSTRITVRHGYEVSESLANPGLGTTLSGANPVASVSPSSGAATRNSVSLDIVPTATTLSAGAKLSTTEDRWLRSLEAEQKLFGSPFSITGAVSERTDGAFDGSLKAGFKRAW